MRDGPCVLAIADGTRGHAFRAHNPEGEHRALVLYVLSLVDVAEDPTGRLWAFTDQRGNVVIDVVP